jgi:curved DNA-binding protein CbpA
MPDPNAPKTSDLPEEMARRVDSLYARLATIDHFALLGIPRSATRAQVRQAFLALAPQFHPDRYFGKNLGPYAAKMQRVFAQLSVAHDTLANEERRTEYAKTLPPPLPGQAPPFAPPPAPAPSVPQAGSVPKVAVSAPVAPLSPEAARARQQAFAARLATPGRAFAPGDPSRRRSSAGIPAVDPQAAVDALRRRYEDSVAHMRGKQSLGNVHAAEAAAAKGDFAEAARLYRAATEHSSDPNLRAVLADTEIKAKEQGLATAIARAKDAEQKQDYADAGGNWARAFELAPAADTAHRASLCLRRAGVDARRAAKYGEEAVKLDPHKASYRINLALVYADLGLGLRARGEIERAQALDPQNAQLKEAFARIKAMR